jgi:hypothetical protein
VFKPDLDTGDITDSITRVREQIKQQFELVQFVTQQPDQKVHVDKKCSQVAIHAEANAIVPMKLCS